jgi:lipoprotein LprG
MRHPGGNVTAHLGTARRTATVALAAALAFGLAGCGDDAPSGPGRASSKDDTATAGDAALTTDNLISTAYAAAMKAGSAHMVLTMSAPAKISAQGDMSYDGADSSMQLTMSLPQMGKGTMEMRYVDKRIYLTIPGVTPGGKFLKVDPTDQRSPLAKSFAGLTDQMDPLKSVKSMEKSVTGVDLIGQGSQDGVSVDHYRVTVDTAEMAEKLGKGAARAQLPKSLTYDMWLDEKNLIRQLTFDISGTAVEMKLSDWGQDVEVRAPAAADIITSPGA